MEYQDINRIKSIEQLFALKHTQWKNESEARFIAFGEKSTYPATVKEGVEITRIFFGLKTSDEDKELVSRIMHGREIEFFNSEKQGDSRLDVTFEEYNPSYRTNQTLPLHMKQAEVSTGEDNTRQMPANLRPENLDMLFPDLPAATVLSNSE